MTDEHDSRAERLLLRILELPPEPRAAAQREALAGSVAGLVAGLVAGSVSRLVARLEVETSVEAGGMAAAPTEADG
jgi:hypothetical protein